MFYLQVVVTVISQDILQHLINLLILIAMAKEPPGKNLK
jgi:hypothetical protein